MEFNDFIILFQNNFQKIVKDADYLFEIEVDKDEFWELYLDSFPLGTNEIYRQQREYDCGCCRHFVKSFGNSVVIKDNEIKTMWDFETNNTTFQPVINALSNFIHSKAIADIKVNKFKSVGTKLNREQLEDGIVKTWNHFYVDLPDKFVDKSSKSEGNIKGGFRDTKNVFMRSLAMRKILCKVQRQDLSWY